MEHREALLALRTFLSTQILGQEKLIERLLIALLADGHMLVEGAPGLAKTKAIKELAEGIEAQFHRIQFTPDLLPADITGTEIYRPETGSFVFQQGPIFHNLVLADEINRAPAKVQSALLEAMAERQVSVGRSTYELSPLFLVMATQNPIEQEGTYPLPEAQLDRFMLQINVGYPTREEEERIVVATTGDRDVDIRPMLSASQLLSMQHLVRRLPAPPTVVSYAVRLARSTRPDAPEATPQVKKYVSWGAGPRASQYLILGAKARAAMDGRAVPDLEDVNAMAMPVLGHRVVLNFQAEAEGITTDKVIAIDKRP
ncbi:MAG: AAA family ATPase [Pseudomonadota bacterium]|nr:AAA family ATPase [Pseudomonadota bacterium]